MLYNIAKSSKPRNLSRVSQNYNSNISLKENRDYKFFNDNFEPKCNFRLSYHTICKEESIIPLVAGATDKLNGLPLNNVSFIFIPIKENNNTVIEKETICKGQFLVKSMEEGVYKVYVKKSGYAELSLDLGVKKNLTAFIEVELEKE
jgi:hypothetical protein